MHRLFAHRPQCRGVFLVEVAEGTIELHVGIPDDHVEWRSQLM